MWSWLNWLYDRSSKVYNIVISFYDRIIDAARNAYNWAISAKNKAISWAYENILKYYYKAKALAKSWVQDATNTAYYLYYKALAAGKDLFAGVGDLIKIALKRAEVFAKSLINPVIDLAWILYGRAVDAAKAIFAGVIGIAKALIIEANAALIAIIDGMVGVILAKLEVAGILDEEGQEQLRLFLTNPMDFFAAYLATILLTMLDYTLGYALGTEKAHLPPPPDFGNGGGGGKIPIGPGPLPGASPLAPPLSYLRQSGYSYTPSHRAADYGCTGDMAVFACHAGKVRVSGRSTVGYGNYVIIQNNEWWSLYAHLSTLGVAAGQTVTQRQPIGLCDTTGNSTGNHLHLELKHYGSFVNPYLVLGGGR